jgi:hypothetical protein
VAVAPACQAHIKSLKPKNVHNDSNDPPSPLRKTVTLAVEMSGPCSALGISYNPATADGGGGSPQWLLLGGSTVVTLATSGGVPWADGKHTIILQNGPGGTVLDSAVLSVK